MLEQFVANVNRGAGGVDIKGVREGGVV